MKSKHDIQHFAPDFPILIFPDRTSAISALQSSASAVHESIEIKCFYEGSSILLVGEKTITAKAGDVIVINPYEFHATLDYGGRDQGRYHLFMINADLLSEIFRGVDLRDMIFGERLLFKNHFPADGELYDLLMKLSREGSAEAPDARLATLGITAEIFSILLRRGREARTESRADPTLRYALIDPAIRMIRDDYSSKFTVEELAAACNISKYYFCRAFKSIMGMSAIQYLNSYRLKIAHIMLTNTSDRIREIAFACGFEDVGYFCRLYKRKFGITPKNR